MPQITHLKLQKNKRIANVFIDNKYALSLDLTTVSKLGLKVGTDISREDLFYLQKKSLKEKLYNSALHYLSYRPRSEKELRTYLRKKVKRFIFKDDEETISVIIEKLKTKNMINDQEFVLWWIKQREQHRPKGKILLKQELMLKGIDRQLIDMHLSQTDDLAAARKLVAKKRKTLQKKGQKEKEKKLIGLLQRRGFGWEIIKAVVDETLTKK